MEITIAWWWLVKLLIAGSTFLSIYYALKYKFRSRKYNTIAIILIILNFINPVKINGTNNSQVSRVQNLTIEHSKDLPKKITDNSFKEKSLNLAKDITDKEIWK